jgi:hypothetical protein
MQDRKCKDLVKNAYNARLHELKQIWKAYTTGEVVKDGSEEYTEDSFCEYGLSFDYVAPNTFSGQKIGYFRYQLSWGGPSEELRFYVSGPKFNVYKVEFWYLDWFDGAKVTIRKGGNFDFLNEIFNFFDEIGSAESEYTKAIEDI